jgi:hypothetical protein
MTPLSYAERRALDAVAETFFPGAVRHGFPDAFLATFVSALSGAEAAPAAGAPGRPGRVGLHPAAR